MSNRSISVIIPVLDEADFLESTLNAVIENDQDGYVAEVICADAGSTDGSLEIANRAGVNIMNVEKRSRAYQMNQAAKKAKGDILYFIHADTRPPKGYSTDIVGRVDSGKPSGCFMSKFDWPHPFLRFCNALSRLPFGFCRGGGQSLFVRKDYFEKIGGYDEYYVVMEEYDLIGRLRETEPFAIIPRYVTTSARDYRKHGAFRLQFIYSRAMYMFFAGKDPHDIRAFVKKKLG